MRSNKAWWYIGAMERKDGKEQRVKHPRSCIYAIALDPHRYDFIESRNADPAAYALNELNGHHKTYFPQSFHGYRKIGRFNFSWDPKGERRFAIVLSSDPNLGISEPGLPSRKTSVFTSSTTARMTASFHVSFQYFVFFDSRRGTLPCASQERLWVARQTPSGGPRADDTSCS